jgi:metallo-beta-lactamase class B
MCIITRLRTWLVLLVVTSAPSGVAFAQTDLSGTWAAINHEDGLERGAGPYAVDYTALPLNDDGRAKALSYSASQFGVIEHQCGFWPPHYLVMGPFGMKIWNQTDPATGKTIAWMIGSWEDRGLTTIWMDGRPHPSRNALHLRGGFTTGEWDGNTLVTYTTHMKAGAIRRNGAPSSDEETMRMRFIRHDDLITVLAVIDDPIYLTEPYIVTKSFRLNPDAAPMSPVGPPCIPTYEGTAGDGNVPHILPGENPSIDELTMLYHIPREAVLGGAETMYPEYRQKMKDRFVRPEKCPTNCGGPAPQPGAPPARDQAPANGQAAGAAAVRKADNPKSLADIDAAKQLAGNDPWLLAPYSFFCVAGGARPNNPNAPELEPARIFDNLYAVGNSEATVYAITTSRGIILIDSGYADRVETVVIPGLRKLGLDPANVKYILLGHGHADHFGGAQYFQEHYGTRVGTTAADWDVIHPANPPANQANGNQSKPKSDLILAEGQPVTLGDETVTLTAIPGHTPGSLAFVFAVKDGRQTHRVGLFGGTILTVDRIATPGLKQYVQSIAHYLETAKKMKVDVEIQNHPIFDMMPAKLAMLQARKAGDPHPFITGTDRYVKFWNVVSECIEAEIDRRGSE